MSRKMYQGGSSRKKGPRLTMREQGNEPPREADVRPCEWPSEEFMVKAGIVGVKTGGSRVGGPELCV